MGIFECNDGTYKVCHSRRHPITRVSISRRRVGLKSKSEAKKCYNELVIAVEEAIKRKTYPTWPELLKQYVESMGVEGVLSKDTIYKRDKVLQRHTLPDWQDRRVDQITRQDITELLAARMGSNAESHRKFFLKGVRSVFQFAVDNRLVDRNPTPNPKFKVGDKIRSFLNQDQILTLLRRSRELDWEWYPHYAVALYTGLRNGELYALAWDDVDLEHRRIRVTSSWNRINGLKSTKSGDDRIVEIPNPLLPILRELKLNSGGSDFVLPRLYHWEQGEQAKHLRLFLKSIGLPEVRFHDLRASWATLLLSRGVPPSKVMTMGGWQNMNTMMIYMRKAGIDIKDSTKCLDDMQVHEVSSSKVLEFPG